MTRIKICGITNREDAEAAVSFGADAIGYVFAASPRRIDAVKAREISAAVSPLIGKVGVFVGESPQTIRETAEYCGLTAVQVYGHAKRQSWNKFGFLVIPAYRVSDESVLEDLRRHPLPLFLLDTFSDGSAGGTGRSFDWEIARRAKAFGQVIVAGGLTADNIEQALQTVHPYAVDVSSGIEKSPGKKDITKMETFIKKVRQWDCRTS